MKEKQTVHPTIPVVGFAVVFFLVRWGIFELGLTPVADPTPGDQVDSFFAWVQQTLFEKGLGMLCTFLIAIVVFLALPGRNPKLRLACAMLSAFLLEGIVMSRYIFVWGRDAYQQYNTFCGTVQATLGLSFIGAGIPYLIVMHKNRKDIEQDKCRVLSRSRAKL